MSQKKRKSKKSTPEQKTLVKKNTFIFVLVLLAALLIATGIFIKSASRKASDFISSPDDHSLRMGETRPTLSPAQFSDPFIAKAYQIAREIPHVLDSLKCYCFCDDPPFHHKSLLSCYVDMHAIG